MIGRSFIYAKTYLARYIHFSHSVIICFQVAAEYNLIRLKMFKYLMIFLIDSYIYHINFFSLFIKINN